MVTAGDRHREVGRIWKSVFEGNQINPFLIELPRRRAHFNREQSKATVRSSVTPPVFTGVEQ
jgi:hypothetical protein